MASRCDYCASCKEFKATQLCTGCRGVMYCSKEHQLQHWKQHKAVCHHLREANQKGFVKVITTPAADPSKKPAAGNTVKVNYYGYLASGKRFDSNDGFEFTIGVGQVIRGWDEGVATMAVGEKATFYISAGYAYGERGFPPDIPPKYPLVFDVELVSVSEGHHGCGCGCACGH